MNIFIDNNDLEEQYGEQKYKEYLEKENKQMKQDITTMNKEIERLNNIIEELKKDSEAFKKFNAWVVNRIEPDWFHKFDLIKKLEELKGDDKE